MSNFHINGSDEVKPCKAEKRTCRFAKDKHFDNEQEALSYVEEKLGKKYDETPSLKKNARRTAQLHNTDNNNQEKTQQLQQSIQSILSSNNTIHYSPDVLIKAGKLVDDELAKRLPFDHTSQQLSQEDLETIRSVTHSLMKDLTNNGGALKNKIYGSMGKELNRAVAVLPNAVKERLSDTPILVKASRKDNRQFVGQHSPNKLFSVKQVSQEEEIKQLYADDLKDAEVGDVYLPNFELLQDMKNNSYGSVAWMKTNDGVAKRVWMGKRSAQACGKKIKTIDTLRMSSPTVQNLPETLDVYEYKTEHNVRGSEILVKKTDIVNAQNSVLLHEYTHLVQQHDARMTELEMFNKLADKSEEHDYGNGDGYYKGFPDDYMGLRNGRELLTRATEGLYEPTEAGYFYGANRGENADEVRQWIMGYWLSKS